MCQSAIDTGNSDTQDVRWHHAVRFKVKREPATNFATYVCVIETVFKSDTTFLALWMFPRTRIMNCEFSLIKEFALTHIASNPWVNYVNMLQVPISSSFK